MLHGGQLHFISIHALREEGDLNLFSKLATILTFQSTPSVRRATCAHFRHIIGAHISIHALREEGDLSDDCVKLVRLISIHALREEGDSKNL